MVSGSREAHLYGERVGSGNFLSVTTVSRVPVFLEGRTCEGQYCRSGLPVARSPGPGRAVYPAWCGGFGSITLSFVPLPAEALAFLRGELLEPVPLSPHSFLFLGGKLSELLESLAEGLTPLRRQLLPATELVPKPLSFLWGKLAPAPVVFPDLLLLPPWKLSESFQPFLQGLLLFWGEGLPFTMAPLQLLPLLGRETVPPPSELVLARPRLGRGLRLGEGLPMRSRRRGLLTPGRGGGHQEEHTTHERSHNASHRALSSVWDSRG